MICFVPFFSEKGVINKSYEILVQQINKESELYLKQNLKGRIRWDQVIESDDLDQKMIEIVLKMALNIKDSTQELSRLFGPVTKKIYQIESEQMTMFVKAILMKTEPWKIEWESRLSKLIETFDPTINQLYGLIINCPN